MKQVSPLELKNWLASGQVQVIDIREPYEYEFSHIPEAESIPMATVLDKLDSISRTKKVAMHCRTGKRAEAMIDYLEVHHQFENLYNLTGGILAWSEEVDAAAAPC